MRVQIPLGFPKTLVTEETNWTESKMLDANYTNALEMRARWLRWSHTHAWDTWRSATDKYAHKFDTGRQAFEESLPAYQKALSEGDTFFMNKKFCAMVDHARQTVPDDLEFDASWLQTPSGWMWIEEPFKVPQEIVGDDKELLDLSDRGGLRVSAIGWIKLQEGAPLRSGRIAGKGATQFLCYQNFADYKTDVIGFGSWSHFTLMNGDKLSDRIRQFEDIALKEGGSYYGDHRIVDKLHEMRWAYTAFYLMAQRLAMTVKHDTDRTLRRRAEREKLEITSCIKIVTLRRMEEQRRLEGRAGEAVDWQWQWVVGGHWRNQYYPSTGEHKPVYVEDYIKGPEGKPLKPISHKIFVARR